MFFSKKLKKFEDLQHCFFSRKNGFSKGLYKSLNCGLGSKDNKNDILKNLKYVSEKIGCKEQNLITLNQRHTNKVIHFNDLESVKNKLTGDAIVSQVRNVGIGILAADCAPILFYDPIKKIIGCAHSGWKGALNGVIKETLKKFNELNSDTSDLVVVVGPCIKKENYKVKHDFLEKFLKNNKDNITFFQKIDSAQYLFDLRGFVNKQLDDLNIKNIENIEIDTFSSEDFFYSYRRSLINKEKDYGRCISVILMT